MDRIFKVVHISISVRIIPHFSCKLVLLYLTSTFVRIFTYSHIPLPSAHSPAPSLAAKSLVVEESRDSPMESLPEISLLAVLLKGHLYLKLNIFYLNNDGHDLQPSAVT